MSMPPEDLEVAGMETLSEIDFQNMGTLELPEELQLMLRQHAETAARQSSEQPAAEPQLEPAPADESLASAIRDRLMSTGYQQLRRIDVSVSSGHVHLKGRVGRYYLRQLAQREVLSTRGVTGIRSDIEVVRDE